MDPGLLVRRVRAASPAEQARLLREALNCARGNVEFITETLLAANRSGALPPLALQTWLGVTRSPRVSALAFKQEHGALTRHIAIKSLVKQLRGAATFEETWQTLGEAEGLALTMAKLSIHQLRRLCSALGDTLAARGQQVDSELLQLRQRRITELFDLLTDESRNNEERRPVKPIYSRLLPACTAERAMEWADKLSQNWSKPRRGAKDTDVKFDRLQRKLREGNWTAFERRAFEQVFVLNESSADMGKLKPFADRSFEFSLRVLDAFTEGHDLRGETPGRVLSHLVVPLAKRCAESLYSADTHERPWRLIKSWLEKHYLVNGRPHPEGDGDAENDLVSLVDSFWDPRSELSDNGAVNFRGLLDIIPKLRSPDIETRVASKAPDLRYHFLRFLLLNSPVYGFDIGHSSETSSTGLEGIKLTISVFKCLPASQGLTLFERCLEANPDFSFLLWGTEVQRFGILGQERDLRGERNPDVDILRAVLLQSVGTERPVLPRDPDAIRNHLRTTELSSRKKSSAQSGDPHTRSFWAVSALRLCVALDDLDLLKDTFIWARRYNRDPVVAEDLHNFDQILFDDLDNALSSMRVKGLPDGGLKTRMEKANAVVMAILETATMVIHDPGFQPYHWYGVVRKVSDVTIARLQQLHRSQESLGVSDDEAYDIVLRPTLDLLVGAEALLLKPENAKLESNHPRGLLQNLDDLGYSKNPPSALMLRFFDTLARERNDLWEKYRSHHWPSVTTLRAPWPRGLPIQHLTPRGLKQAAGCLYVRRRIETVIFCDPAVALQPIPDHDEVTEAVGTFVDSWPEALGLWLSDVEGDKDERDRRVSRAWTYALGPLTGGRMVAQQAQHFWMENGFKPAGAEESVKSNIDSLVQRSVSDLPEPDDSGDPTEWDPDPEYADFATSLLNKNRRLGETICLDCMLLATDGVEMLKVGQLRAPAIPDPVSFWDSVFSSRKGGKGTAGMKGSSIDAAIVAATLYANSVLGADASLLMRLFPEVGQPRFPAVYLDQEFLQRPQDSKSALSVLEHLLPFVPPQPLANLAASIMTAIESGDPKKRDYASLSRVIKMLVRSDNPNLAAPVIQRFILGHPNASSWYRVFLNRGVMKHLDAESCERFFMSLAGAIVGRLKEQESNLGERPDEAPPLVKVSTVKMIAQLLRESCFIGSKITMDILMQIAREASHVDIRLEAVKSMKRLASTKEQRNTVLDFLRDWAPRIAGAMNERRPETEADWEAAENGGPLPEVAPQDDSARPVLRSFADEETKRDKDMLELGLKMLEVSAENNTRWTRLFLQRHGFTLGDIDLPSIPTRPQVLVTIAGFLLASDREHWTLPIKQFESMRRYVLIHMDPPEPLLAITRSIEQSAELARSNAGQHWLEQWGTRSNDRYRHCGEHWMCDAIRAFSSREESQESLPDGFVTCEMLEDAVMDMAEIHLSRGQVTEFETLVGSLNPGFDSETGIAVETKGCGKVLRRLIDRINALRTAEWQADPNRQPPRLPDTFKLQLKLLSLNQRPWNSPPNPAPDPVPRRHVVGFVDRIVGLLQRLVDSGLPYFEQYTDIEKHLFYQVGQRYYIASLIGSTDRFRDPKTPTLVDLLCVRLAVSLLKVHRGGLHGQEDALPALRGMVSEWETSVVEELREQANSLRQVIRASIHRQGYPLASLLDGEESTIAVPMSSAQTYQGYRARGRVRGRGGRGRAVRGRGRGSWRG